MTLAKMENRATKKYPYRDTCVYCGCPFKASTFDGLNQCIENHYNAKHILKMRVNKTEIVQGKLVKQGKPDYERNCETPLGEQIDGGMEEFEY